MSVHFCFISYEIHLTLLTATKPTKPQKCTKLFKYFYEVQKYFTLFLNKKHYLLKMIKKGELILISKILYYRNVQYLSLHTLFLIKK